MTRTEHQLAILEARGCIVPRGGRILDLGCGNGQTVFELRQLGYDAYGCDLAFKPGVHVEELRRCDALRLILQSPYKLPFRDEFFDAILSDQVFEHVADYDATIAELRRVLRNGGVSLHIFPSRFSLIEPHVHVPLASWFRPYAWLYLWAFLGLRAEDQAGLKVASVARENLLYLRSSTNYLSKGRIVAAFRAHFDNIEDSELEFLQKGRHGRWLGVVAQRMKCVASIYSAFRSRVMLVY